MKLRACLVDDEPLAIARLQRLLDESGRVEVVGSARDPEDALEMLRATRPDVCFLDVEMPGLTGFEMLSRLPAPPDVVFVTAHDRYALGAFAANSIDYLLKPVDAGELDRALVKLERLRGQVDRPHPELAGLFRTLAESLRASRPDYPTRIASRSGDRLWFIDLALVTHFYAEDKLTYAVERGKPYSVDYTIEKLERLLDPSRFLRIHRGTIVNVAWIREVSSLPGGGLNVRLKNAAATDLVVSRDRAREFKARLLGV